MAPSVLIFLAWSLAMMAFHRVMVAPWHQAHADFLKALADREPPRRRLGGRFRAWWLSPAQMRRTLVYPSRRGMTGPFFETDPDPEVERLRLRSLALWRLARRWTLTVMALYVVGGAVIFRLGLS